MSLVKRHINSSFEKKLFFNDLLLRELGTCKFSVIASYEWKRADQICSIVFDKPKTISLRINLNFQIETVFWDYNMASKLTALFRAYYIATYIHCLENASDISPATFFQGMITIESFNDINGEKEIKIFTPFVKSTVYRFRAIDIHCAIYALNRLCMSHKELFSAHEQENCERIIDHLINYTLLPEVNFYKRNKPEYAIISDLIHAKEIVENKPNILSEYLIFSGSNIMNFDESFVDELCARDDISDFWANTIMRLLAFSENPKAIDITGFPALERSVAEYKQNSVEYFRNCENYNDILVKHNLWAIKKVALKIDNSFFSDNIAGAALHFIM